MSSAHRRSGRGRTAIAVAVAVALGGGGIFLATRDTGKSEGAPASGLDATARRSDTTDPIERGCALGKRLLYPIYRGHHSDRSEDLLIVQRRPNYPGTFNVNGHSGPWHYLQNVPLVLYGPERIRSRGEIRGRASVVDIYPTAGALSGVDLPERDGRVLDEALLPDVDGAPRLMILVVWDGVGRNVLERWPAAWPNLARLSREGTSYLDAVVGSSPSITPATHSSMGTGTYPRSHGATGIEIRGPDGEVRGVFENLTPNDLQVTTYADEIDRALRNEPLAGMLAWRNWHLGMLGHGAALPGGDHDQLALVGKGTLQTNPRVYSLPSYLQSFPGLQKRARELDRADGEIDGRWLGHGIFDLHDNPAWVNYEADILLAMLEREGYGSDEVPDFFFTNFKMSDIVGHQYTMDSEEERVVLGAQDAALGRLIDYLDGSVRDYVVVVTADHGHTPSAQRTGAWPVVNGELRRDLDEHFDVTDGQSLVDDSTAVGFFLNTEVMEQTGVTATDMAEFMNRYTLKENASGEIPGSYAGRATEQVLAAAFPADDLPEVLECAFGTRAPPIEG